MDKTFESFIITGNLNKICIWKSNLIRALKDTWGCVALESEQKIQSFSENIGSDNNTTYVKCVSQEITGEYCNFS